MTEILKRIGEAQVECSKHPVNWLDVYVTLASAKGEIELLQAEVERLRAHCEGEIAEFNAGWECASNGGTEADEPMDVPHDVWMCGFAWQRYDGLKAGVARLQAMKAAAIKVVEQTTPDAAYQLHDDLIAAIESVEGPGWEVT